MSAAAPPRAERWRDRWARAGAAARRHWLILAILAPAIALRVLAQLAYKPLLLYIDSYVYLANLHRLDPTGDYPIGYPLFLRPLLWLGNLAVVAAIQHLLGLAMGVTIYLLLQRWGVRRWLAALAAAPVLLDAYQVQIEHNLMADTLFMAMLVAVVAVLTWRPRPGFVAAAVAGLLLGAAVVVRLVGEPLVLIAILFVAVAGSGRWRRLGLAAAVAACFAVPVARTRASTSRRRASSGSRRRAARPPTAGWCRSWTARRSTCRRTNGCCARAGPCSGWPPPTTWCTRPTRPGSSCSRPRG